MWLGYTSYPATYLGSRDLGTLRRAGSSMCSDLAGERVARRSPMGGFSSSYSAVGVTASQNYVLSDRTNASNEM